MKTGSWQNKRCKSNGKWSLKLELTRAPTGWLTFYNFPSVALWKEMNRFICTSWAGGAVFLCAVSRSTQGAFLGRVWGKEDRMAINDYPPRPPSCTGRQWLTRPDLPPTLTHLWGHRETDLKSQWWTSALDITSDLQDKHSISHRLPSAPSNDVHK